jgi:hypothetical protein
MFWRTSCSVSLLEISNRSPKLLCWSWLCRQVVAEIILKNCMLFFLFRQRRSICRECPVNCTLNYFCYQGSCNLYRTNMKSDLQVLVAFWSYLSLPYSVVIKVQVISLNCVLQKFAIVNCCKENESIFHHVWSWSSSTIWLYGYLKHIVNCIMHMERIRQKRKGRGMYKKGIAQTLGLLRRAAH